MGSGVNGGGRGGRIYSGMNGGGKAEYIWGEVIEGEAELIGASEWM